MYVRRLDKCEVTCVVSSSEGGPSRHWKYRFRQYWMCLKLVHLVALEVASTVHVEVSGMRLVVFLTCY